MNPADVPDDLTEHAARAMREFDPRVHLSVSLSRMLARVALAATLWRVELRAGTGTHVCPEVRCTCGYGGYHEPENPGCERNQAAKP